RVLETTAPATTLEVKLFDEHDKPRYIATVEMGASHAQLAPPVASDDAPGSGEGATWSIEQVYSEVLFHRPPFAGLRSAAGPDAQWSFDPAIIDGGLQLACVWGRHVFGGVPLPTSFGAFELYRTGPVDEPVRCVLKGRRAGQRRVLVDLAYVAESGHLIAYLRDLEMHLPLVVDGSIKSNGAA